MEKFNSTKNTEDADKLRKLVKDLEDKAKEAREVIISEGLSSTENQLYRYLHGVDGERLTDIQFTDSTS